ncbi:MAG: DUF1343 domain-containing protein [Defluviitaleaceae bacterium]|nr:DUF1343 domain-containing protein [Defluviitaleaceae bacterium]
MTVKLGIDQLNQHAAIFEGKRIGLLTNNTGINSQFQSTIDLLHGQYNLTKLFAPEHGVRGNLQAGVTLEGYHDESTGLPVISLYGANRRPSAENLADIDVVAFDIQNVGSRFYTYLYSMAYVMEACAEYGKEFVVFDRPNPLGADKVEGNILDLSCKSFIGLYPIPQRYGLTIGECARLFNAEYGIGCNLTVIPMEGYRRDMSFEATGLPWVLPSPNIPTVETCFTFNATCIFEGTNVSEGRGTTKPFSFVGAPWLDGAKLAEALNAQGLPGVKFRAHYFTPLPYHPKDGKYAGELCGGVEVHVLDRDAFRPVQAGVTMLYTIRDMGGQNFKFLPPYHEKGKHMIDYNTGDTYIREDKYSLDEVLAIYAEESKAFAQFKSKYHLYD